MVSCPVPSENRSYYPQVPAGLEAELRHTPLNFRNLPKAFKAMQGAMGMSLALRAAYNLEKCALD